MGIPSPLADTAVLGTGTRKRHRPVEDVRISLLTGGVTSHPGSEARGSVTQPTHSLTAGPTPPTTHQPREIWGPCGGGGKDTTVPRHPYFRLRPRWTRPAAVGCHNEALAGSVRGSKGMTKRHLSAPTGPLLLCLQRDRLAVTNSSSRRCQLPGCPDTQDSRGPQRCKLCVSVLGFLVSANSKAGVKRRK